MMVPNRFPILQTAKRIAVCGEAPGKDEEEKGRPFVGASGRFLALLLARAGVSIDACFLGNISQHRPQGNDFSTLSWTGTEVQTGLLQLKNDLALFKPNIVVLLGNVPLKAAKDCQGNGAKYRFSNAQWRGSVFRCDDPVSPFAGFKCITSYHPAYCLRDYKATPLLQFDLRKAVRHSESPDLTLQKRNLITHLSDNDIITRLRAIRQAQQRIAIDIEGYVFDMSCISIATSHDHAFIIPFRRKDGSTACGWEVWKELALTLEDENVPKILQNSLYDRFVLHYGYGIRVRGVADDTMLKHWELYCELEKALGVQASIYTDEPYYKGDGKSNDDTTFWRYCCRDSAVTYEISDKLDAFIHERSRNHYQLNVVLLNPLLYMELRGIRYDAAGAKTRRDVLRHKMFEAQRRLNAMTGHGFEGKSVEEIKQRVVELMWTKKHDRLYKEHHDSYKRVQELLQQPPTIATMGELEDLCEVSLNVESNKQLLPFLYETLKLPTQMSNVRGKAPRPTADYEALLNLSRECQKKADDPRLPIIQTIIELRALRTRQTMLAISSDPDGQIRCGYNIVGSNTGRLTCYESPTGSGYNLQTIPNYTSLNEAPGSVLGDRDLFLSDEGFYFFQCDLSGADGWTVAAYSAFLGDETMLLDYKAGVSPFKVLTLMLRGLPVPKDRSELREAVKVIGKDDWDRFAMKRVQHGGCVTGEHEVLTKKGWFRIDSISDYTEIMVYDSKTRRCFFEPPSGWTRKLFTGDLVKLEGTAFSLLCTPEHRVLFDDNGTKVTTAQDCLTKKSGRIPYTGNYVGGNQKLDGRLAAAIHADGCISTNKQHLQFHFRKERKIERLKQLLGDIPFKEYKCADGTTQFSVWRFPESFSMGIRPGPQILDWDIVSISDYVDEIKFWDGCIKGKCVDFSSVNKGYLDWIRTAAQISDFGSVYAGTSISGFGSLMYCASINNRKFAWINSLNRNKLPVIDKWVFCPNVSTSYFLIKHDEKISITGNSYLEGALTISRNILKDSEGKLALPTKECEKMKEYFFARYPGVRRWHDWVMRRLKERPFLTAASGSTRQFFGRTDEILTKAVAFEPQHNTTYAIKIALKRLWTDQENRMHGGGVNGNLSQGDFKTKIVKLRIEPLHTVHDSLNGQFKIEDTEWAVGKIRQYFDNVLRIAGQQIIIPFEGGYGSSWGNLENKL